MINNITNTQWKELLAKDEKAVVLDVRTAQECTEGVLKDAIQCNFLDRYEFMSVITELDKSKHYYIYCRSGNRSGQACEILNQMGFAKTYNLAGGMLQWDGEIIRG